MARGAATLFVVSAALALSSSASSSARAAHPVTEWIVDRIAKGSEKVNNPVGKLVFDAGGHAVVGGAQAALGAATYSAGWWIAVGWKATDLTAKLGDAALHAEDESRGARMIVADRDAALLKKLVDAHVDLDSDPRAIDARARLKAASQDLNTSDLTSSGYLLAVTRRHLVYAATEVAASEAASWAIGNVIDHYLGDWIKGRLPANRTWARSIDGRSRFQAQLKVLGWSRFADREKIARKFTDRYARKLADAAADRIVDSLLKESGESVLDHLCERMRCNDTATPIAAPVLRLEMARFAVPVLPAQPVIAPVRATAIIPAPVPVMRPVPVLEYRPAPGTSLADPLQAVIQYEDRIAREPRASEPPPPVREPERADPEPPSEWQVRLHHEWDCVGAGNKAGCGDVNWDGRRQP
ncbi:MAG: hypothetical protein JWN66_2188 [Sphingomonas bacterium]|uniref:hypothetical protein n=1 Tax=Sphingomonas bacterium TaxID=1895847 RepID=UPI00261F0576|nr:hypothetical protein [Sphingomonas bacterium]MDB5705072.1 hypothetical protein [Sphingomonas bacterium]